MKCLILKPFGYAADHIHARDLAVGSIEEIADDIIPGLVAGGFIDKPAELVDAENAGRAREAAELIASIDSLEWQQWSVKAKFLIGEGAPAKKADILAALKTIADAGPAEAKAEAPQAAAAGATAPAT
ncbi:MAG: hypothetical protein J0H63_12040 [Rhizobiales bacterium]|nr:hypothetical protein [Hyphomicrobiales bacterium]MBN9010817.1 hypothetical protein [Hyphomicrobiales bacterium]